MLNNSKNDIHIFGLSETKLKHYHPDKYFFVDSYQFFRKDRILSKERCEEGGGIIVYVRNELKVERRCDIEMKEIECLVLEVFPTNSKSYLVGMSYRHPNETVIWNENFEIFVDRILETQKEFYLLGDFNRDLLNENIKKNHGWNLLQMVNQSTRKTSSSETLIDQFYCNIQTNLNTIDVPKIGLSDHFPIFLTCKTNFSVPKQAGEETPGEMITQELPDTATVLQDSPVMRKISILMGMINSLQGQITTMQGEIRTLTKEVNELTTQAAYKTVDETYISDMSRETVIETVSERELSQCNNSRGQAPASQPSTSYSEVLQQRTTSSIPNQQNTNKLMAATPQPGTDGLQRTSTPKIPIQQHTDRAHTTPRLSQQGRQGSHLESRSRPSEQRISTKKILLMGDSVISPVNPRGLRKEVFKHSISGARIDHIFDQTNIFNMNQFSEVIIFVGGNDASNGTDIEYFEELYEQVILNLKQVNDACQIYLCNVSPRRDTDTAEVNQAVHRLCQEHNLTMVDINKAFYDKQGKIIERYYGEDLIHLSSSGVKRLLGEIDREINIVENFENCAFKNRYQKRGPIRKGSSQINSQRSSSGPRRGRSGLNRQNSNVNNGTACYKCGETNPETSRCKHKEQLKCYYCGFYGHKSGRCLNQ